MTDRERLIEIVRNSLIKHIDKSCRLTENIVDDLLTEKVTFPPVAFSDNRRERMIELLNGYYEETGLAIVHYFTEEESEMLADYILSDGWIRPPCKAGDVVYVLYPRVSYIEKYRVVEINLGEKHDTIQFRGGSVFTVWDKKYDEFFGKTIFLTREEAEKALAERQGKNEKP